MTTSSQTPEEQAELETLVSLAERQYRSGRFVEAAAAYRQMIALRPDNAEMHSYLGNVLLLQGQLDEAVAQYERAIALKPDLFEAYNNLGNALRRQGQLDQAAARHRQALALRPDLAEPHNNLGNVLSTQGKLDEAAVHFKQASALRPDLAEPHYSLGNVLLSQKKFAEAAAQYQQALVLRPDLAEAHYNLGNALLEQGKNDEAAAQYDRALALNPEILQIHNNLGAVRQAQGKLDEAALRYGQALAQRPDQLESHYNRAQLKTFQAGDSDLAALEAIAADPGRFPPDKMPYIHFALGKALEDVGDYPRAFEQWLQGNALRRRAVNYNEAAHQRGLRSIAERFDRALLDRFKGVGDPSPAPIFVLGMPRSGSTLVEQILASHPQVHAAGELRNLNDVVRTVFDAAGRQLPFPQYVSTFDAADFRRMGHAYLASLPKLPDGKIRITDKMPLNFLYVGLIRLILPNARIIHTMRDPVDTCVSCFTTLFTHGQPFSYDLAELGRYYRWYHRLMAHWRAVLPAGVMFDVAYEDVVDNLEKQARRLIDFCGLPWDNRCLSFYETSRSVATASNVQVRQPIYRSSLARWRRYEAYLQPLLAELGGCLNSRQQASLRVKNRLTASSQTPPERARFDALVALAQREHGAGRLAEAAAAYRQILALRPDAAEMHNNLGNVLFRQGKLDEAVASYEQAIALKPGLFAAHNELGCIFWQQGRLDQALARLRQAIALAPGYAEAYNNLGNVLKTQGQLDQALAQFERAVALKPGLFQARINLGDILQLQGKLDQALAQFKQAIALAPNYAEAYHNLGIVLADQGKLDQAQAQFEHAVALKPDLAQTHYNLGNVLRDQGKFDQAEASYGRALALDPNYAEAHNNLGSVLRDQGKLDEARARYDRALALRPDHAEAHYFRTDLKTFLPDDADLAALETLAADPSALPPEKMLYIHFALGKALEDIGDYPRAFEHLLQGNALKRRLVRYDETAHLQDVQLIADLFDRSLLERFPAAGDPSPAPIFIVGMPRSGSTLIEQILASHPQVYGAGELLNLDRVVRTVFDAGGGANSFTAWLRSVDAEGLRRLGQAYLASLPTLPVGKTRITDKLPANILRIGLIRLILPNARIIHTMRDPVDTCVSCFSRLFSDIPFSYDLGELGRYYRSYLNLMDHWRAVLPAGAMLDVSYEAVVDSLEEQARRLIDYCGLPWDDRCLSFHRASRPVTTASNVQVRRPIYRSSVARWRRYEAYLQPLLAELEPARP